MDTTQNTVAEVTRCLLRNATGLCSDWKGFPISRRLHSAACVTGKPNSVHRLFIIIRSTFLASIPKVAINTFNCCMINSIWKQNVSRSYKYKYFYPLKIFNNIHRQIQIKSKALLIVKGIKAFISKARWMEFPVAQTNFVICRILTCSTNKPMEKALFYYLWTPLICSDTVAPFKTIYFCLYTPNYTVLWADFCIFSGKF